MSLFDWEGPLPEESNEQYHARDERSSTNIKYIGKSPWHYKKFVIDHVPEVKDEYTFGTIAHSCNLENKFDQLVAMPSGWETVAEQKKRGVEITRTIAQQKQDFIDHHDGFVVSQSDYEKLEGMSEAFRADDTVQSLIDPTNQVEAGFRYWDPEHQEKCRFRADIINFEKGYIVDYKTAQSATEQAFKWAVIRYGYHVSAAHYVLGAERLAPGKIKNYYFIVQEKIYPFACATYRLSETDIMFGANLRSHYLKKIKKCTEMDYWPGYTDKIRDLVLPDAGYNVEDFSDEA